MYWYKDRHRNPRNKTEGLKINLHIYGQLISKRLPREVSGRNNSLLKNAVGRTRYILVKNEVGSLLNWIYKKKNCKIDQWPKCKS